MPEDIIEMKSRRDAAKRELILSFWFSKKLRTYLNAYGIRVKDIAINIPKTKRHNPEIGFSSNKLWINEVLFTLFLFFTQ
ncbi:hypothetical protein THO17_14050 [Marinomonas sp. THO17]